MYKLLLKVWTGAVFFFLLAPLIVVIPVSISSAEFLQFPPPGYSLRWFEKFIADPQWVAAASRSVAIGAVVTFFSVVLGIALSFSLVRCNNPVSKFVEAASLSPMVVPQIVFAVSIYGLFVTLGLAGTVLAIVIAHTILALPFVIVIMVSALRGFDTKQEEAARGLGATQWQAVLKVTLPQMLPAIVTSAFLAFISSFDELVVAMFVGGQSMTMPRKMFENIKMDVDPTIAVVSVCQIVLLLAGLLAVLKWGKKPSADFNT